MALTTNRSSHPPHQGFKNLPVGFPGAKLFLDEKQQGFVKIVASDFA